MKLSGRKSGASARNVVLATIGNIASPAAGLIAAPILAQSLGPVGRGEVAAGTAPLLLAVSIATLGIPEAVTFYTALNPRMATSLLRRGIGWLLTSGVIATLLLLAIAPGLAGGSDSVTALISVSAATLVPCLVLTAFRATAAGHHAWILITWERLVSSGLRLIALVALAISGTLTPLSATISFAASFFVGIVVYAWLPRVVRSLSKGTGEAADPLPSIMGYGFRIWIGSLTGILLSRLDQTLMTPLAGSAQLGFYAVAASISEIPLVFNSAIRDVMFSAEAADPQKDRLTAAARVSTLFTAAAAVVIGVSAPILLPLLFGREFTPAVVVTELLLIAVVLGNPGSVAGAGLSARGRPGLRSWALAVACGVNVLVLLALVPSLGAWGAALATLVGNAVAGFLNLFWMRRRFGVPILDFVGVRAADFVVAYHLVTGLLTRKGQ